MPSVLEYVSCAQRNARNIFAELAQLSEQLTSLKSYLTAPLTSSPTDSTESGGDGSVPSTTGPITEAWAQALVCIGAELMTDCHPSTQVRRIQKILNACPSYADFAASVTGGSESQPPRSDSQPARSRGESSDPTPTGEPSQPTSAPTRIDLNDVLRTVAVRAFGSQEPSDQLDELYYNGAEAALRLLVRRFPDRFTI